MTHTKHIRIAVDAGILVTNMERSLYFYRVLLELPVVAQVATSLIGKGTMVQLRHGESLIKLVELEKGPSQPNGVGHHGRLAAAYGIRYITLMVVNIVAIMERVEQTDTTITLPLTQLGNGALIAMVADPDGNIVEFVQESVTASS